MVAKPLVRHLAQDNEVWAAARFKRRSARENLESHGVRTVVFDLSDPDFSALPADFDYVLNFAVSHAPDFPTALRTNAENLGLLMRHVRGARAFLHCSSTGVYQPAGEHRLSEDDPLGDNHRVMLPTYSISKIAAEVVARLACRENELPTVIPRLNVPYGESAGVPAFQLESILSGAPIGVHADGPSLYNPIHSDDIVRQVPLLLGVASVPATTLNWAGPDTVSMEEWCEYIGDLVGRKPSFSPDPAALGSVAVDTTRMHELIGPAEVNWRDGIRRMVAGMHPELELAGTGAPG
jgi:nucleoside-diphosphate-sugar epimerase